MSKTNILGYSVAYFATKILQAACSEILPYLLFSIFQVSSMSKSLCISGYRCKGEKGELLLKYMNIVPLQSL